MRAEPFRRRLPSRGWPLPIAMLLALILLAGCGGSSKTTSPPEASPTTPSKQGGNAATSTPTTSTTPSAPSAAGATAKLKLAADPSGELKYNVSSLSASTGSVTIEFSNASPLEHNVTVASASGAVEGATPTFKGGSKTLSLNLKPGTYKFYCTVPGHRAAGMEGTLIVR
jgi:plastocyanin